MSIQTHTHTHTNTKHLHKHTHSYYIRWVLTHVSYFTNFLKGTNKILYRYLTNLLLLWCQYNKKSTLSLLKTSPPKLVDRAVFNKDHYQNVLCYGITKISPAYLQPCELTYMTRLIRDFVQRTSIVFKEPMSNTMRNRF